MVLGENLYSKLEHLSRLSHERKSPLLTSCMANGLFDVISSLPFSVFLQNIFSFGICGERFAMALETVAVK